MPAAAEKLFDYQKSAVDFLVRARQAALFFRMGLGKTAVALHALARLHVRRTLVVAPLQVVERDVWGREAKAWEDTAYWMVQPILGTPKQRLKALAQDTDVDVVNYELLPWLFDEVSQDRWGAIVFDELSRVKTPGSQRFKALRSKAADIPIRFGLTGSPVGNHLLDVWGELFQVAGDKPLGPSFGLYQQAYFCPVNPFVPRHMITWQLKSPQLEADIHERIRPFVYSLSDAVGAAKLPALHVSVQDLGLPKDVQKVADDLAHVCVAHLENGVELQALSASAQAAKVRQLSSGAVYTDPQDEAKPWEEVHPRKLEALREVLEEQQGDPVLCFYWFQHELARLRKAFPRARLATDQEALDAWDRKEVPLLLAHPASAGHGLNLQKGGSTVVWFSLPWSHELWEQSNGRLVRVGQPASVVSAIVLACGDIDRAILEVLRGKGRVQQALVQATTRRTLAEMLE